MTAYSQAEANASYSAFHAGTNASCFPIQENFMHMFRPADAPGDDLPWTGLFTGMLIGSLWYWCADQVIVQRTLASKNLSHAKGAVLLAGTIQPPALSPSREWPCFLIFSHHANLTHIYKTL
jgi:hypothetical protein